MQFFQPSLEITIEKLNIKKGKQRILIFLNRESNFFLLLPLGIISIPMCHVLSEHFCRFCIYSHSVSRRTDPSPHKQTTTQQFFLSSQALENLASLSRHWKTYQVPSCRQKALIIPTFWSCLTITIIRISEQPANTSEFPVMLLKWFDRTKMLQN